MHGILVKPTLFNIVVDNTIRTWLAITVEDQRLDHNGMLEAVGRYLGVFYADDGMVGSKDAEWIKHLMNVLVGLFWWYYFAASANKYRMMTYQPDTLRSGISVEAKALKCTGVGYSYRVRLRRRIHFPECGV